MTDSLNNHDWEGWVGGGDSESGNQLPPISLRMHLGVRLGERQQPTPPACSDRREGERRMDMRKMGTWSHIVGQHNGKRGIVMEIGKQQVITREKRGSDGNGEVGNITDRISGRWWRWLSGKVTEMKKEMVHILRIERADMSILQCKGGKYLMQRDKANSTTRKWEEWRRSVIPGLMFIH